MGRSSGYPADNNYRVYVNGIEVMDTDYGFVSGVSFTTAGSTNGTGYTNSAGANVAPTVTFSAPTGVNGVMATATGVAVMNTGTNLGTSTESPSPRPAVATPVTVWPITLRSPSHPLPMVSPPSRRLIL